MKHLPAIALLLLLSACSNSDERAVYRALHAGSAEYQSGKFAQAAATFGSAPEDARLFYNRGDAFFRIQQADSAIAAFQNAERMADSTLVAGASYNLGTTRLLQARLADSLSKAYTEQIAGISLEGQDIARNVSMYVLRDSLRKDVRRLEILVDSALIAGASSLKNSLRTSPTDEDARHNLIAAQRLIASRAKAEAERKKNEENDGKKELGERAMLIMQKAEELVEQYKFNEALNVLKDGLKKDPSLEQRKDYMDKLELVQKAAAVQ